MPRPRRPPYRCPSCMYETDKRHSMISHFNDLKKPCPKLYDIELTPEIKEHVLANRVYNPPSTTQSQHQQQDRRIKKLELELQTLKNKRSESFYQALLEKHLQGQHLAIPGVGVTDVTTDSLHAEIKGWSDWKAGLGQLMAYNHGAPRKTLQMYFFGPRAKDSENVVRVLRDLGIEAFELNFDQNTQQHVQVHSFQEDGMTAVIQVL